MWSLIAVLAIGCRTRSSEPEPAASAGKQAPAAPPSAASHPALPKLAPRLGAVTQIALAEPAPIGLPPGCHWQLPMRRLELRSDAARFMSPPHEEPTTLAVAVDDDGDGKVDRAAALRLGGGLARPLPWLDLDAPPALATTSGDWLSALSQPAGGESRSLVVWRTGETTEALATGDHLEAVDAECRGPRCTVLSTVATRAGGSGASVFRTDDVGTSPWARTDVRPESDGPWAPYAIVTADEAPRVAVTSPKAVELWQITRGKPVEVARFDVEHRLYDVLYGTEALALVAAAPPSDACGPTRLSVVRRDGRETLDLPVPPESLLVRPLSTGFFVAWIGPRSCTLASQPMVYGAVLDQRGRTTGAPMAMADAAGFSLSSHGDTVDLFLSARQGIVWATAQCAGKDKL